MTDATDQLFVCIGARINVKTLMIGLIPIATLEDTADEGNARWFKAKRELKALVVGNIYSAPATETGVVLEFKRAGRYADTDGLRRWRVLNDSAEVAERMHKIEADDRTRDVIAEALAPIRAAYQQTDARGKRAIEALVLDRLRKL